VVATIFIIHPSGDESRALAGTFASESDDVRAFVSAEEFLRGVTSNACGCVVVPSDLRGLGIRDLLSAMRARGLQLPVVVLGRDSDVATAVELVRAGAAEYLGPPISRRRLRSVVRATLALHRA
jgi:FixJ family two-component response regulator